MAIYVDTFKCSVCNDSKEVVHTGRPTRRDFDNSELFKNQDGEGKHVCWNCESDRESDE